MAFTDDGGEFEQWLRDHLDSHGADGEVFGDYISGTLNTMEESSEEEIFESLLEILQGCVESDGDCEAMCRQIAKRWVEERQQRRDKAERIAAEKLALSLSTTKPDGAAAKALSGSSLEKRSVSGVMSVEEKKKLIAQYGCESDEDEDEEGEERSEQGVAGLFQNINSAMVAESQRVKKEQQKAAHEAKLERDKRSREMQKQKAQDRKEKEKKRTQKHERRR